MELQIVNNITDKLILIMEIIAQKKQASIFLYYPQPKKLSP